jgi:hypothetical protein
MQYRFGVVTRARKRLDEAIDPIAVRPIAFDGDEGESLLLDEALRDLRAPGIELGGAMRRLAEQQEARIANQLQQRVEVVGAAERPRCRAYLLRQRRRSRLVVPCRR